MAANSARLERLIFASVEACLTFAASPFAGGMDIADGSGHRMECLEWVATGRRVPVQSGLSVREVILKPMCYNLQMDRHISA